MTTKIFKAPIIPQVGDRVVAGPESDARFEGVIRAIGRDGDGASFVVVEVRYALRVFQIVAPSFLRRITEDHRAAETRVDRYDDEVTP